MINDQEIMEIIEDMKKQIERLKKNTCISSLWVSDYIDSSIQAELDEIKKIEMYRNRMRSLGEELTIHHLKIDAKYYANILLEKKKFEIRKNDREPKYKEGQFVFLNFISDSHYIGQSMLCEIVYVLENVDGLQSDYVILGIQNVFKYKGEVQKV